MSRRKRLLVPFQHVTHSAYRDFLLEKSSLALCVPRAWNIPDCMFVLIVPWKRRGHLCHSSGQVWALSGEEMQPPRCAVTVYDSGWNERFCVT